MLTLKDIVTGEKELNSWYPTMSLKKIAQQDINDIYVQISNEYGYPVLRLTYIVMADGNTAHLNDHDRFFEDIPDVDLSEAVLEDLDRQIKELPQNAK